MAHPMILSLGTTILILLIFPIHSPKYKLEIINNRRVFNNYKSQWDDLENDGTSDLISTCNSNTGMAGVTVNLHPTGHVEQWDFRGQFKFEDDNFIFTGDYDGNGKHEIYAFTLSNDTVYLNSISDFYHLNRTICNLFITTVGLVKGQSDVSIAAVHMADLNHDGYKELIFSINAGFSIYPRAVFIFDIKNKRLLKSPELGFYPTNLVLADFRGNGNIEIVPAGYAPKNITAQVVQFNDSSSWVMVLNSRLQFVFPPVELPGRLGGIFPVVFPSSKGNNRLTIIRNMPPGESNRYWLYMFDAEGRIVKTKQLLKVEPETRAGNPFVLFDNKVERLMIPNRNGQIFCFDTMFNLVEKINLGQSISEMSLIDIDNDNQNEIILRNDELNRITVFRNNFKDPVSLNDIKLYDYRRTRFSLIYGIPNSPRLFIHSGDMEYTIVYGKTPMRFIKWIIYLSIYLSILLFTILVRKNQSIQLRKRYDTEKKITELQLKIVRNQMDPHFTLNAINTVVDAINKENKEEARENLVHFSKMFRSLVLSADKIKRTLGEEIEFTENYLALEKFRFGNRFNYKIVIDPEVDLSWDVPKMVIQSSVENAVKHGLLNKDAGGVILIHAARNDHKLSLEITDNGVGRSAASQREKSSTGKGLEIMEQFFILYHKITGIKVQSSVIDLEDENGIPKGTKVVVEISLQ